MIRPWHRGDTDSAGSGGRSWTQSAGISDSPSPISNPSAERGPDRRLFLAAAVVAAAGCRGSADARPVLDAAELQRLVDTGSAVVAAGRYRLTVPLRVPAGRRIGFAPGVEFVWAGHGGTVDQPQAVIEVVGDDVSLAAASGGEMVVTCEGEGAFVYAVGIDSRRRVTIEGVAARGCQHVRVTGAPAAEGEILGLAAEIHIRGGGARFDRAPQGAHGACLIAFCTDWSVADCRYERVAHGVQWWGGDADPARDGASGGARRCRRFRISSVVVTDAGSGGIWGSSGEDGEILDCRADHCGDVGFDAEGSARIVFRRCVATDAVNGCFAAFFRNDAIRFVDCVGKTSAAGRPLFRLHNATQDTRGTGSVEIVGGRFSCTAASPGTIDAAAGPTARFAVTRATLTNVRIDTGFVNMHRVEIVGNRLRFGPSAATFSAIRVGGSAGGADGTVGGALVSGNEITAPPGTPAGSIGIEVVENDYNAAARSRVTANTVSGFARPIAIANGSANPGIVPQVAVDGNYVRSASPSASIEIRASAATGRYPEVRARGNRTDAGPLNVVRR